MSLGNGHDVKDEDGRPLLRYHFKHEARFILFERLVNRMPESIMAILLTVARLGDYRLYDFEEVEAALADFQVSSERKETTIPVRDHVSGGIDDLTLELWRRADG